MEVKKEVANQLEFVKAQIRVTNEENKQRYKLHVIVWDNWFTDPCTQAVGYVSYDAVVIEGDALDWVFKHTIETIRKNHGS